MSFVVESKSFGEVAVVYPQGYLNNIVGEKLEKECINCLEKGIKTIVIDFGKTEFINSIGISILLSIIERLKKSHVTLCFSSLSNTHKETFEMLGLIKYARVFRSEDEALKHLKVETKQ